MSIKKVERTGQNPDYGWLHWKYQQHFDRYKKYVLSLTPPLLCQECGGAEGWVEPVLEDGSGPWDGCGWCESTGYVTPWIRGQWLRWRREMKKV